MKSPYISDLQPDQTVTAIFLVQYKDIRQKKSGEPYLALILSDKTGDIEAKMWDNVAEIMHSFDRDDFLRVRGLLQIYNNRLQFTVHKLQRQEDAAVDLTDFFPASSRNPEVMFSELRSIVAGIGNSHLSGLLWSILNDQTLAQRFKVAPAAKNVHHAFLGGLLEHVLSLCKLAQATAVHYPHVDLDLLLAGAILHDIGKVDELAYERSFGYSTDGQLLGHIVIGLRILDDRLRSLPDFPHKLRRLLEHMIISHHGELAFGSPKAPVFPEALLLHHLDNLDSKMECMRAAIEKDRQVDGCWTGYHHLLERSVLKKSKYLSEEKPPRPPATPSVPAALPSSIQPPAAEPTFRSNQSAFAEKLKIALKP